MLIAPYLKAFFRIALNKAPCDLFRPVHKIHSVIEIVRNNDLYNIPGTPPDLMNPPKGDAFALRSDYAMKLDYLAEPPMFKVSDSHYAATWLLHPLAPKVEVPINVGKKKVNIDE